MFVHIGTLVCFLLLIGTFLLLITVCRRYFRETCFSPKKSRSQCFIPAVWHFTEIWTCGPSFRNMFFCNQFIFSFIKVEKCGPRRAPVKGHNSRNQAFLVVEPCGIDSFFAGKSAGRMSDRFGVKSFYPRCFEKFRVIIVSFE